MTGQPLRVGLIGLGDIQAVHSQAYRELEMTRVTAVCDLNPAVATQWAKKWECEAFTSIEACLASPDIDMVDLTLPHSIHYSVARMALQAGKHVLIEKPMTTRAQDAKELIELAQTNRLLFTVAENTRFVHAYQVASEMLRNGQLGTVRLIRTLIYGTEVERLSNPMLWKGRKDGTVGGVIMDSGPHSFYLLKWLNGEIDVVQALTNKVVEASEVEDHAIVSGRFRNGGLFSTEYTFTAEMPWGERLELYGTQGTLIIDQLSNPPAVLFTQHQDTGAVSHSYAGTPIKEIPYEPMLWKYRSIVDGVKDFIRAVQTQSQPSVDPWDGQYVLRVIEAAYESWTHDSRKIRV